MIKFKPWLDFYKRNGKTICILWYTYKKERLYKYLWMGS